MLDKIVCKILLQLRYKYQNSFISKQSNLPLFVTLNHLYKTRIKLQKFVLFKTQSHL